MHIAIDVRSLMEGRHSGVEEYTIRIIDALSRIAASHTYHLFYNSAKKVTLPKFRENVVLHAFRYPNKIFNTSQLLCNRPRWDRMLPVAPDVVFVPNPRLTPLSYGVPLVTCVHDLSFERFPEFLTMKRRLWHTLMRPQLLLQNSDHVIAVSEHTKEDVVHMYGIDSKKISVIYSGVSSTAVSPGDVQRIKRVHGLPEKFLLFIGTQEPRKNIAGVIDAYTAIAHTIPHHLVIAGERGWKTAQLAKSIASSAYGDRIHSMGFVEESEKSALYAAADLFVYPSFYEGFGFPPLEAMLAGTPAVVSFNSSLPEIVGEWATMVDPYNTAQLSSVLRELLTTPTRVPETVRAAIRAKYSWDRAAKETIKVLESVV